MATKKTVKTFATLIEKKLTQTLRDKQASSVSLVVSLTDLSEYLGNTDQATKDFHLLPLTINDKFHVSKLRTNKQDLLFTVKLINVEKVTITMTEVLKDVAPLSSVKTVTKKSAAKKTVAKKTAVKAIKAPDKKTVAKKAVKTPVKRVVAKKAIPAK